MNSSAKCLNFIVSANYGNIALFAYSEMCVVNNDEMFSVTVTIKINFNAAKEIAFLLHLLTNRLHITGQ